MSSTTTPAATSADQLFELAKLRRSVYPLSKEIPISNERVKEIVERAVLLAPSPFNNQANRAVVLFGAEHDKFWDITRDILKAIVPEDSWAPTAAKMDMFKAGAGSILFFSDTVVVEDYVGKFPTYADKFPQWAEHSAGMYQWLVWTGLAAEGVGSNLQHYNPLVDEKVKAEWKIPALWKLTAHLVFGGKSQEPEPKDKLPVSKQVQVFGL